MKRIVIGCALCARAFCVCLAGAALLLGWRGALVVIVLAVLMYALWPYIGFEASLAWPHKWGI